MRINQGQTYLSTVPSELMRQGNFSEINRPIYDPLTGAPFPGNIIPAEPLGSGGRATSCATCSRRRTRPAPATRSARTSTTT